MSQDEQVICLQAIDARFHLKSGLNRISLSRLIGHCGYTFRPRSEAEGDESTLHLATYAVLTCGDRVFTYRRGASGGESRLHGRRSLGVGGHVVRGDFPPLVEAAATAAEAIRLAAWREVAEEVAWDGPHASVDLGLLYDDGDAVSRVHIGVAYRYELADTSATAREDCLADARWEPIATVRDAIQGYESWSAIILREALT